MAQLVGLGIAVVMIAMGADQVAPGAGVAALGAMLLAAVIAWGR